MNKITRHFRHASLFLVFVLLYGGVLGPTLSATAKSSKRAPGPVQPAWPRSGKGRHKGPEACRLPDNQPDVTAMVPTYAAPEGNTTEDNTVSERPTFLVYVPFALTEEMPGELELQRPDEAGRMSYRRVARIVGTPAKAIVRIPLPTNQSLKENERVQWRFTVKCGSDPSENPSTVAIVVYQPQDGAFAKKLPAPKKLEDLNPYIQAGAWYDALSLLAELRVQNPRDAKISAKWKELLKQGGLSIFDTAPIAQQSP